MQVKTFQINIAITPIGKERARIGKWGAYTPAKTVAYELQIKNACQEQAFLEGFEPLSKFAMVSIVARMPVPKSASKKDAKALLDGSIHTKKPDVDNITKAILDAMNEVVYTDDNIVHRISAEKIYSENPGLTITVTGM